MSTLKVDFKAGDKIMSQDMNDTNTAVNSVLDFIPSTEGTEGQVLTLDEDGVLISGAPNYSKLVSAIIGIKYSLDAQIAILANKGDEIPEHEAEYLSFESWRAEAKRLAKSVFTISEE